MTDTAASYQWAIEMFWALFWGALTSSIFILQSMVSTISSCYDCFPIPQLATRHKALSDLGLGGWETVFVLYLVISVLYTEKKYRFQPGIVQLASTTTSAVSIRLLHSAEVCHCSSTRECIILVVAFGQRFWP